MSRIRFYLALTISTSLILVSPGAGAWAQVARVSGVDASAVPHAAPIGAGAVSSLALAPLGSALSASLSAPPVAAAATPAQIKTNAAQLRATHALPVGASAQKALTAAEIERTPDVAAKDAADRNFSKAVGEELAPQDGSAPAVVAGSEGSLASPLAKTAKGGTPDSGDQSDGVGQPVKRDGTVDELGNERREGGAGGSTPLINPASAAGLAGLAAFSAFSITHALIVLPLVLVSLILHEIGHAKAANWLGDPTAAVQGRASYNPLKWGLHVDPMYTFVYPVVSYFFMGIIFGGARPVPVDSSHFKNPKRDMALVAFAGPAVNLCLAVLGAGAAAGAAAAGLGALVISTLTSFVFINVMLALFNLIPMPPLDGSHIIGGFLPGKMGEKIQNFVASFGALGMIPVVLLFVMGGGAIMAGITAVSQFLLGISMSAAGVHLAGAALPAVAALGMLMSHTGGVPPLTAGPGAAPASRATVERVVVFSDRSVMTRDLHITSVDPRMELADQLYLRVQSSLAVELASAGLGVDALEQYGITPIATYKRINAATVRLDAEKAAEFDAAMAARGNRVYDNARRKIIIPSPPVIPENADPSVRNPITMAENVKITKADSVLKVAEERWGKPELGAIGRLRVALGREQPPQPLLGVIDSGADLSHPQLKRVKAVKNQTAGPNVDDIGHGSWVTSMVLNYAPWAKSLTHYKTFVDGSASTDDILKSLTAAANDGNLVISNSWGDDSGDPEGPDSLLVKKLAAEGHIMVFAAGNAGPRANTVGAPAIVQYKDPETGTIRVVAVAAADRNKAITSFSSVGPGSPKTKGANVDHRPDLAALGFNTEGAWPADLGGDRTDPELGHLKAISGTSMSTPSVAGAIALLLMMFGVTEKGAKLDAVVAAVMTTLEKTGKNDADHEGQGFLNVEAAYEALHVQFFPGGVPPTALRRYRDIVDRLVSDSYSKVRFRRHERWMPSRPGPLGMSDSRRTLLFARLRSLEERYPGIKTANAGLGARLMDWLRGSGR